MRPFYFSGCGRLDKPRERWTRKRKIAESVRDNWFLPWRCLSYHTCKYSIRNFHCLLTTYFYYTNGSSLHLSRCCRSQIFVRKLMNYCFIFCSLLHVTLSFWRLRPSCRQQWEQVLSCYRVKEETLHHQLAPFLHCCSLHFTTNWLHRLASFICFHRFRSSHFCEAGSLYPSSSWFRVWFAWCVYVCV